MTIATDTRVQQLADAFARELRETLSVEHLKECIALNDAETDPLVCHSHDHCDANQVMLDAAESLGIEYDSADDENAALMGAAWDHAKATRFALTQLALVDEQGDLCVPGGLSTDSYTRAHFGDEPICLLMRYDAGDCDTFPWPLVSAYRNASELREQLRDALFGAREMGHFPSSVNVAVLPDGERVDF